jgi:putative ABC transport system substrate-binding protein
MNYYDMGRQTGKIVVRILKGEKPGAIAPEVGSKLSLTVNPSAAIKQGARCPPPCSRKRRTPSSKQTTA